MKVIKKTIFALLLSLGLTCVTIGFSACGGEEKNGNSTTSEHTHEYISQVISPTCTEKGYTLHRCSCNDTYKDNYKNALGHSFTNYVSNNDATQSKDGTETATCDRNGCNAKDTRTDEGSMLSHTHNYSTKVTPPTCTEQGYTTYTCTCGDSYNADYENALGHSFTNYVSNNDATYEKDGTKTAYCDNGCGAKDTVADEGLMLSYFSFVEYGNGYALQDYTGSNEIVEVPATYNGKNVVAIGALPTSTTIDDLYIAGDGFYENTTVKEIILPNTIKAINVGAFAYSSVSKINIPTGCRVIYDYAFYSCANLSTVIFEGSIFTEPFEGCNVMDVVVKETATYTDGVFSEFNNLQRLTVDSLNTTAKALFKTELGETIPGSTSYATATIYSKSQMYPEKVNSYTYNNNTFGVPVSYCNWYYDGSTKTINGVTMTYDGNPGVVTEWEKHYEVTVGVTYYVPASATFTFYVSTDDQYTGDTYLMPTNFEKLTITEQLFSANDEKLADCPFAIDYEKYPISAIEVVGATSFYPDNFDYADYQVKLIRADNSYEFTPLRQEYLSTADQNLLKTSGEHNLTVKYDGVSCGFNVDILFYDFEGYVFDSKDFIYDGTEKSLEVANLPDGTSVTYHNNGQMAVGEYTVTATLTKQNYNQKIITATLRIFEPTYSINYVIGRENVENPNPNAYNYGETLDLLAPICNGYEFLGWYLDANFTQAITQIAAGEYGQRTLYARWNTNTYTVSFTSGTGYTISATKNGQSFTSGSKITVEDTVVFTLTATTGYTKTTLAASGTKRSFVNNTLSSVYEDITISGGATANQYTVSFSCEGEILSSKQVTYGSTYGTLPTITKTGYTLGWYTAQNGGTKITSSTTVTIASTHTLYAIWSANKYTLSFNSNGGNSLSSKQITYGSTYGALPTPTKKGYTFCGWRTSYKTEVFNTTLVQTASNHTLYAYWTANKYTVSFVGDGADNIPNIIVEYDSVYGELPVLNHDKWEFKGWWTAESGGEQITNSSRYNLTNNQILYARWKRPLEISTKEQLKTIQPEDECILLCDLDLGGEEWTPIGSILSPFKGVFNGNGFSIYNFKITACNANIGFFGVNAGTIKNLSLKNFSISINVSGEEFYYGGGLVGYNYGNIIACSSMGDIKLTAYSGSVYVGGLVGYNYGSITDSYAEGTARSTSSSAGYDGGGVSLNSGGLVGVNHKTILNCYANAEVVADVYTLMSKGYACAGGLVADNYGAITNCYATGNITTEVSAYQNFNGTCYSVCYGGGLIGYNDGTINSCYAIGDITVSSKAYSRDNSNYIYAYGGGLIGYNLNEFDEQSNCFKYSKQSISRSLDGGGSYVITPSNTLGEDKEMEELTSVEFQMTTLVWSTEDWIFTEGQHPTLKRQN